MDKMIYNSALRLKAYWYFWMIDIREKKKLLIEMYWECDYIGFIYLFYKLLSTRLDIVNILKKILFRRV